MSAPDSLVDDAAAAGRELLGAMDLPGRVDRHPYGMVAAALGAGYVLGGGLFTPTTARLLRLGFKVASLPNRERPAADVGGEGGRRRPRARRAAGCLTRGATAPGVTISRRSSFPLEPRCTMTLPPARLTLALLLAALPAAAVELDVHDRPVPRGNGRPTVTLLANSKSADAMSEPMAKLSFALRDLSPVVVVRVDLPGRAGAPRRLRRREPARQPRRRPRPLHARVHRPPRAGPARPRGRALLRGRAPRRIGEGGGTREGVHDRPRDRLGPEGAGGRARALPGRRRTPRARPAPLARARQEGIDARARNEGADGRARKEGAEVGGGPAVTN